MKRLSLVSMVMTLFWVGFTISGFAQDLNMEKYQNLLNERKEVLTNDGASLELLKSKHLLDLHAMQRVIGGTTIQGRAPIENSKDPKDLEPFRGALWVFASPDSWTYTIYCNENVLTSDEDGTVYLYCKAIEAIDSSGSLFYNKGQCSVLEKPCHQLIIDEPGWTDLWNMTADGNIVDGIVSWQNTETEELHGPYTMKGFKFGPPICDKNNDDKLGLAEAIHYLKIATGQ